MFAEYLQLAVDVQRALNTLAAPAFSSLIFVHGLAPVEVQALIISIRFSNTLPTSTVSNAAQLAFTAQISFTVTPTPTGTALLIYSCSVSNGSVGHDGEQHWHPVSG